MVNQPTFTELHRALVERFDYQELSTLCAQLEVPFDDLGGEGRSARARELVLWMGRRGRLDDLAAALRQKEEPPLPPLPPPTPSGPGPLAYDVFVSHADADRAWVRRELLPHLEQAGLRVCVAERDFVVGVPTIVNVERAIDGSRHTLVVLTPAWLASEWRDVEGLLVAASDPAGRRRKLLPLILAPCTLPPRIAMLWSADLTDPAERPAQLARLIESLRPEAASGESQATGSESSGRSEPRAP